MQKFAFLVLYEAAIFGGGAMTDIVYGWAPLWFWTTITVAAILGMPALYTREIWRWVRRRGSREDTKVEAPSLHEEIVEAYRLVQRVHRPDILNPAAPGNMAFMAEEAQDAVDVLRPKLLAAGLNPPAKINIGNKKSLEKWYDYLRIKRAEG